MREKEYEDYLRLWKTCFGDERDVVEEFCESFAPALERLVLTEEAEKGAAEKGPASGRVRAELTRFPMGRLVLPDAPAPGSPEEAPAPADWAGRPIWCSYAICTDPAARGKGYGGGITVYAAGLAEEAGGLSVLCPADDGLVNFYRPLGFREDFLAEERTVNAASADEAAAFRIRKASPEEYNKVRERLLQDRPHLLLTEEVLRYADLCGPEEKGLYLLNEGEGAFALEDTGEKDELKAVELLMAAPEEASGAARMIARQRGGRRITYRTPAAPGARPGEISASGGRIYVQAMMHHAEGAPELKKGAPGWYGFPFE